MFLNRHIITPWLLVVFCLAWLLPQPAQAGTVSVKATSAISMDADTGTVFYEKNADTLRSIGSITKLMTAYLVFDALADGRLQMDTPIAISDETRRYAFSDGTGHDFSFNSTETVETLLPLLLVASSNVTASIFAEHLGGGEQAFVEMMNQKAVDLGIAATFNDAAGLRRNAVSARAVAELSRSLMKTHPGVLQYTSTVNGTFHGAFYENFNNLLSDAYYPGADGMKTGWIPASGFCLSATAERDGNRALAVVLNTASFNYNFIDGATLLDDAFTHYPVVYPTSAWAQNTLDEARSLGYDFQDIDRRTAFEGTEPITRGEFAALMAGVYSQNTLSTTPIVFDDIADGAWYAPHVQTAYELGIVAGTAVTKYSPEALITREQVATMIARAETLNDLHGFGFTDEALASPDMLGHINSVAYNGLMVGDPSMAFRPKSSITREEATVIAVRLHHRNAS